MTGSRPKRAEHLPLISRTLMRVALIAAVTFFGISSARTSAQPTPAGASAIPPAPLPVDIAFPLLASYEKGAIRLKIDVLPGHYVYRERFEFQRDSEPAHDIDRYKQPAQVVGKSKQDPHFGAVKVFDAPVTLSLGQSARAKTKLVVTYQGCSELSGVCYPPTRRSFELVAGSRDVMASDAEKPGLGSLLRKNVSQ